MSDTKATATPGAQASADAVTSAQTGAPAPAPAPAASTAAKAQPAAPAPVGHPPAAHTPGAQAKADAQTTADFGAGVKITDFAGTVHGVFAVYGENLDKGGQLALNGQVPQVTLRRADVIKGILAAPGLDLKAGPVTVTLGGATFHGVL